MSTFDQFSSELAASLSGPRRSRRRLLTEIEEHFRDAVSAELAAGRDAEAAESEAIARLGSTRSIAVPWNQDRAEQRGATRRNVLVLVLALVAASALGLTQYAAGKNSPAPAVCGVAIDSQPPPYVITRCSSPPRRAAHR